MVFEWLINKSKQKFYPITHAKGVLRGDNGRTINEIGMFGWTLMVAREVLAEPVTLQPGEKHTFTMTVS